MQDCPHCGKPFTIGAGLSRHKSACQYKEHERAGQVIDLEGTRASARLEERDYQRQVRELCRLGGRPELAEDFISRNVQPAAVGQALLESKVAADQVAEITSVAVTAAAAGQAPISLQEIYRRRNAHFHRRPAGATGG